jgi:adenylate cyclase, class 2
MAIETEKKYRMNPQQREQVLKNLEEIGAEYLHKDFEVNQIYGGGILEEEKAALRIRKTDGKTLLTYKRRVGNLSNLKQHIEHETEVGDAETMENIIKALGFELGLVYEKYRQTWKFQNVEIVLDELPFGLYMEIEGKITDIGLAEMLLDIEDYELEPETYPKLTFDLGEKNGNCIEARFEKTEKP